MSDHNAGSFFTGLTVGLFAGAAGYFLLNTKDGKKTLKKIKAEWDTAQDYLQEEGLADKGQSLKSMVYEWFDLEESQPKTKSSKKKATTKTPKKKKKFKGV
jgi:gas vesicle protein